MIKAAVRKVIQLMELVCPNCQSLTAQILKGRTVPVNTFSEFVNTGDKSTHHGGTHAGNSRPVEERGRNISSV